MIKIDPKDPFLIYALSLEIAKEGNIEKAIQTLQKLQIDHPDYLGLYHQLAHWQLQLEHFKDGLKTLELGIEIAKKQGNNKAANEMNDMHWQYSDDD